MDSKRVAEVVSQNAWAYLPDYRNSILAAVRADEAAEERLRDAKDAVSRVRKSPPSDDFRDSFAGQREEIASPRQLLAVLPSASVSAKTDADGKCRLLLPAHERWVIAAVADRDVVGNHESYTWIVELPKESNSSSTLTLSNDNLLKAGSNPLPKE